MNWYYVSWIRKILNLFNKKIITKKEFIRLLEENKKKFYD